MFNNKAVHFAWTLEPVGPQNRCKRANNGGFCTKTGQTAKKLQKMPTDRANRGLAF